MKRTLLSLCLIGALTLTSTPAFAADAQTQPLPFADVAAEDWFYDAVAFAYDAGIMTGVNESAFAPDAATTRAMIASVLYRLAGSPDLSGEILGYPYADVPGDTWYAMPIYWARLHNIMNGYSASQFGPNDPITREQLAATLYKYAAYTGIDLSARADLSSYSDAPSISAWAIDAMRWANAESLISGITTTTLAPSANATRAQVAAIFQRYLALDTPGTASGATLVIGQPGSCTYVDIPPVATPEDVIAALSCETGWNLSLNAPIIIDADGLCTISFADGCGINGEPPEPQNPKYHVFDRDGWIASVSNSINESLRANGWNGARFLSANATDIA